MSQIDRRDFLKVAALTGSGLNLAGTHCLWSDGMFSKPPSGTGDLTPRRLLLGAQVTDDPVATDEKVDGWFKTLADHHMRIARVFIPHGERGLESMDRFFRAAEKYGVKITATLGGEPSSDSAAWLEQVVKRYMNHPALDSWILANEPGGNPNISKEATDQYRAWLKNRYQTIDNLNSLWGGQRHTSFDDIEPVRTEGAGQLGFWSSAPEFIDWYIFSRELLTERLRWIAEQIRKYDAVHPTHTNPAGLVDNLATNCQDLPAWKPFLSTLGASCHPTWHFSLLRRDEYAIGVAYISDLVRGAIEPKPFWITEMQGGNNINSGNRPLCPTKEDIAQWVWTALGSGAERVIFWLLNAHSFGTESAEWSLLDLQNQPSERLKAAGDIARILIENTTLFAESEPVQTPITILLSLDAMTLQARFAATQPVDSKERGKVTHLDVRSGKAHIVAALAYYEIFHELGFPVHLKHVYDFDFSAKTPQKQLAILPNLSALSKDQALQIGEFARNGNTVLATGLTGFWDEYNRVWPLTSGFPLEGLFGATFEELRTIDEDCAVKLIKPQFTLPSQLWIGTIRNSTAEPIAMQNGWITGVRKRAGEGEIFWIPSTVDVGAWIGDRGPLREFVKSIAGPFIESLPFRFSGPEKCCVLRTLKNPNGYLTVVTNGSMEPRMVGIEHSIQSTPKILWGDPSSFRPDRQHLSLGPRATVVASWQNQKAWHGSGADPREGAESEWDLSEAES